MRDVLGRSLPHGKQTSWSTKRQNFPGLPVPCLHVLYDEPATRDPPPPPSPPRRQDVAALTQGAGSHEDAGCSSRGSLVSGYEPEEPQPASSFAEKPLAQMDGPAQPMARPEKRPAGLLYGWPEDEN